MTKKDMRNLEQKQENDFIMVAVKDCNEYMENITEYENVKRLRHCTATVYTTPRYYVLRSYNTIVAFIDRSTGEAYDVLRYVYGFTSTSSQHISKFFHDYGAKHCYRYYATY